MGCQDGLHQKTRWVLDGHKTADPVYSTYAGVVSYESVRIALTYAALNKLDVCAANIQNAYIQAPSSRKDYVICGPEFGLENIGRVALIHRALYGGKTAGRNFRNHLRFCMRHLLTRMCGCALLRKLMGQSTTNTYSCIPMTHWYYRRTLRGSFENRSVNTLRKRNAQ